MDNYLKDIVLPYYTAQVAVMDNFVMYDLDFKAILASPGVLKRLCYKKQEDIIGEGISDYGHIKSDMIKKLQQIFQLVVNNKKAIKFISVGGQVKPLYKNHYELVFQSYTPILDLKNNVVAVVASKIPTIEMNFINLFFPEFRLGMFSNHLITEKLTKREFEILYLLSNGLSQYQIAEFIGVSRSTVLKTIMDRILDKIGIVENKSDKIIKKALQLGIYGKIPRSLVEEQVIILKD